MNASPVIKLRAGHNERQCDGSNGEIAILLDCPRVIDTYDLVTRLYPYGGAGG